MIFKRDLKQMKCKLRREIKDGILILIFIILAVSILVFVLGTISAILGYVLAHYFNLCLMVYAESPIEYYTYNGAVFGILFIILGSVIFILLSIICSICLGLYRFKWSWRNIKGLIIECE